MYLLRRSAFRALSRSTTPFIAKPQSISVASPAIFRAQQQWTKVVFQKRFYTEGSKEEEFKSLNESSQSTPPPPAESDFHEASSLNVADSATTAQRNPNLVYVGNIFFEVTEDQLRELFSKFGAIDSARIIYDARGLSRGFGFVEFKEHQDAQNAIESLNQHVHHGRLLTVQLHAPKRPALSRRPLDQSREQHPPSKTLFIGNMSFDMSDKDLNDLFKDIQNVLDVRVAIDRRTGKPRGFAHADFINIESAAKAREQLSMKEIYGRRLRVDYTGHRSRPVNQQNSEANF